MTRTNSLLRYALATGGATALAAAALLGTPTRGITETAIAIPPAAMTEPLAAGVASEKAVLAGGCFWGMQAVFQHVKGVTNAVAGYAGGPAEMALYEEVGSGRTGHAESVEVTFDPHVVNYATLLQIYFSVAHDPTELNYQGPDSGTQYRSAIFPTSAAQKDVAAAYIGQLGKAKVFGGPIVTTIEPGKTFYPGESYHQDYATLHPDSAYIAINDLPKVDSLSRAFPDIYAAKPKLVADSGATN